MQFSVLPVNAQWAILTVLRGPDRGKCKYMKELFTARVRYWVHGLFGLTNFKDIGAVTREYAPDQFLVAGAEKEAAEWLREDEGGYFHWSNHIRIALLTLRDYYKDDEVNVLWELVCTTPGDGRWVDVYTSYSKNGKEEEEL
jgi:hypothetical protein